MTTRVEQPSEAERFEAETEAGPGADDATLTSNVDSEKGNDKPVSPSGSLHAGAVPEQEKVVEDKRRSKGKTVLLMGALCMAVFLAAIDTTIITTAVPTISAHFHSSSADYTWIGSAYLLAAASSMPIWGKLSDIWGRKPIILVANVVFFAGSLISAVSHSIKTLLAGRVVQGIGGGGLIILVNICISDLFSMRSRGLYFGIIGMVWAIASALGPVLGGVFTEKVSWRWCFYINLPCDGLAFIVLFFFLDIETPTTPIVAGLKAIDWLGSLTIAGGTVMFLLGLEFGGVSFPWASATVICLLIFGVVVWTLFVLNERKFAKYPVMPLRLFKRRSNIAALVVCFTHGMTFIAGSYFLPLYFQAVLGASPILSGVYLFPFVISLSLSSAAVGIFIRKTGQYLPPIYFGLFFMTLGFGLYIDLPAHPSWARIILYQIIAGLGVGPNFQSPLIALQSLVQPKDIATATATFGFTRNLASSISVVLGGVIFQNGMRKRRGALEAGLPATVAAQLSGGEAGANTGVVKTLPAAEKAVAAEAFADALRVMEVHA
ncbi:MAG: major facilitator superfamily transporter [Lasallia pustulata]|uniref:Efflux pump dotC n=1 Tax=Lasallia pustulata TaxID=136370 RepID=A0A5M8Q3S1_9LECA|nr:MAG: major facilitator superfamily transporter [Lasallia pustulata]